MLTDTHRSSLAFFDVLKPVTCYLQPIAYHLKKTLRISILVSFRLPLYLNNRLDTILDTIYIFKK